MCNIFHREGERYNLRTFLFPVSGADAFVETKTVACGASSIYRETRLRQGHLFDVAEWKRALWKTCASSFQQFPELFTIVLAHREPAEPRKNVENFKDTFISNICKRLRSQPLLSDDTLEIQHMLADIRYAMSTISRIRISQICLQMSQNNLQPLCTPTHQPSPEQIPQLAYGCI